MENKLPSQALLIAILDPMDEIIRPAARREVMVAVAAGRVGRRKRMVNIAWIDDERRLEVGAFCLELSGSKIFQRGRIGGDGFRWSLLSAGWLWLSYRLWGRHV